MNIDQISAFVFTVKNGSFSKAAEQLFISQPTLSHRITELEKELNSQLLEHKKGLRSVELTVAGAKFLPHAELIYKQWYEATRAIQPVEKRTFNICTTSSLAVSICPYIYEYMRRENPEITVSFIVSRYADIYTKLNSGEADIAFLIYPVRFKGIETIPIATENVCFCSSTDSIYSETVNIKDLDTSKEVYMPISQEVVSWHDYNFGSNSKPLIETGNAFVTARFLKQFDVWTIMEESTANKLRRLNWAKISELTPAPPKRTIYLAYRTSIDHEYFKPAIDAAYEVVKRYKYFTPWDSKESNS